MLSTNLGDLEQVQPTRQNSKGPKLTATLWWKRYLRCCLNLFSIISVNAQMSVIDPDWQRSQEETTSEQIKNEFSFSKHHRKYSVPKGCLKRSASLPSNRWDKLILICHQWPEDPSVLWEIFTDSFNHSFIYTKSKL